MDNYKALTEMRQLEQMDPYSIGASKKGANSRLPALGSQVGDPMLQKKFDELQRENQQLKGKMQELTMQLT